MPPQHHHAPHRGPGRNPGSDALVDVLQALIDTGSVRDAAHLADIIERIAPEHGAVVRALREPSFAAMRPAQLLGIVRAMIDLGYQQTMCGIAGPGLVVVAPLPPHILDVLVHESVRCFVVPDGHPIPPPLRWARTSVVEGRRKAQIATSGADSVLFEAARGSDGLVVDLDVLDIVAPLLACGRIFIHLRGHVHHNDTPLTAVEHPTFI